MLESGLSGLKISVFLSTGYVSFGKLLNLFEPRFLIGCNVTYASEPGEENFIVPILQMKLTEVKVSITWPKE